MKAYIKDFINLAESLGWSANYDEQSNEVDLQQYPPMGEDFSVSLDAGADRQNLAMELDNYYQNFDPEEHAVMWWKQERGFGLRNLLDDAEVMEGKLQELNREYQH